MIMKRVLKSTFSLFLLLLFCMVFCMGVSASAAKAKTPGKVTGLKVTSKDNTIALKWNRASNAKGYTVYRIDNTTGAEKKYKSTTKTSLTITKCTYNTKYTFKVGAYGKSSVKGALSNAVSVTPTPTKPTVPKNFSATSRGNKSINLKWSRASYCNGYIIESYDTSSKTYQTIKTITSASTREATIRNLTPDQKYTLRIRSYRTVGGTKLYSSASNTVSFTAVAFTSEVSSIRSARYKATVKTPVTVKTSSGTSIKLAKGVSLTVNAKSGTNVTGYLANGTKITIRRSALSYKGLDSSSKNDYSKSAKEMYVNLKGYSSSTNYLIWVSHYKLKVNVFQGSKGKWKLVQTFPCCVGKWSTRSPMGLHKILKSIAYGEHGGPYMYFSTGKENGGTVTNPKGAAFHNQVDRTMSKAVSGGCVRMRLSDLRWLYNHCKVGTTVLSY